MTRDTDKPVKQRVMRSFYRKESRHFAVMNSKVLLGVKRRTHTKVLKGFMGSRKH